MKRSFCILLALVLALGLLPGTALAATSISSVTITLDAPVVGASPDYTAVFPSGAPYYSGIYEVFPYHNDIAWWDVTNDKTGVDPASGVIVVSWAAAQGADHYRIARQTTGTGYILLDGNFNGTTYEDTEVVEGSRYRYYVCAENDAGKGEGANSNLAIAVAPLTVPAAVTSVTAEAQPGKIVVSWAAAQGADHYRVARQTTGTGYILLDGSFNGTTYEDTDVVEGGRYRYLVCAENSVGKGPSATSAVVVALAP